MSVDDFSAAAWIGRPVPAAQRIRREIRRSHIDWVEPGHSSAQIFHVDGPIVAVNIDLAGPRGAVDPFATDVKFSVRLEDGGGALVAERDFEGPQLVWDWFGILLDIDPPAQPGRYSLSVSAEREAIGWYGTHESIDPEDDGISPLPVDGTALSDGEPVPGRRLIGVETLPAPNPLFRRVFDLAEVPTDARLSATVLGTGVLRINGRRVGDEMLEPAVTNYDRTVLYRVWDVAHLLRTGRNEILVEAGRERYAARGGDAWGWNLAAWHREPVALAQLDIEFASGACQTIATGSGWSTAEGPVEHERLFRGEDWVVRAADPEWAPATEVAPPRGVLKRADLPPVRALPTVSAVTDTMVDAGVQVFDFGEVMTGRIRCRVTGPVGASITVTYGEQRDPDGRVICENFLVAGKAQVDTLRLERAAEEHTWEPQFGYRGFRWMQIETDGGARVDGVRAVPLYTELPVMGTLTAENDVIQWIDAATARTFRNNLHGIPTDTPIYEKNGWTADAHLATEALLHHFDLRGSFTKWLSDHDDAQGPDGAVAQIIPTPGWGAAADPAWSSSAAFIPWHLYREYGSLEVLSRSIDTARRLADHVIDRLDGGLWLHRSWGDWLSPGHMLAPEGMAPSGTIMSVSLFQHVSWMLEALGDPRAEDYRSAASATAASFHAAFFDARSGHYSVDGIGYRQGLNILPLAFGAVPAAAIDSVRRSLVDDLESRTDGHLDCGALGIRHLLPVLSEAGRDDLAITVLTRESRPGWGAWYRDGENTLLESWDADARSRNHYFLGSVSSWIQQRVGALRLIEPGWRRFEVAPVDDPRVARARARHRTPLGEASAEWERGDGGWSIRVEVPEGSEALVRVAAGDRSLRAGWHSLFIPQP